MNNVNFSGPPRPLTNASFIGTSFIGRSFFFGLAAVLRLPSRSVIHRGFCSIQSEKVAIPHDFIWP
jgi:hypothetical protein